MTMVNFGRSGQRLYGLVVFVAILGAALIQGVEGNCDVYKRTMDSIRYWHSYNFTGGMNDAIEEWFAPEGKITIGIHTMSPTEFYSTFNLVFSSMTIDVQYIDCAADGDWCHLKVYTTFHRTEGGDTVSIPQYWTYVYDPVTCQWAHYIILTRNNDLEHMVSTLGQTESDGEL